MDDSRCHPVKKSCPKRFWGSRLPALLLGLVCSGILGSGQSLAAETPEVTVLLWFDTEDYLLPASDDALLRLARFLTGQQVRATFKIVGEKARVLEQRGRRDVLEALGSHEVGYHTDFHSVQPSPAMFLSGLGWFEGVDEFDRREHQGFLDVARITGQTPSCYGQPGSSWGPQSYGALRRWGVRVYLDAGDHVDVDGRPFWYAGILTLYSLQHTLRTELGGEADLLEAQRRFQEAYHTLLAEGGGIISIYYHPCEFVHREFWDAVNFSKGANPPREAWKIPPAKDPTEAETAFRTFESFIRFISGHPGVRFRTASETLELYPDRAAGRVFSPADLKKLAAAVAGGAVDFQLLGDVAVSPAEQFVLLTRYLADGLPAEGVRLEQTGVLGPVTPQRAHGSMQVPWDQFQRTVRDVVDFTRLRGRVPDDVWLGSRAVSPESFLAAAGAVVQHLGSASPPRVVELRPATLKTASRVRNDKSLWGWVIFPPDFEAPAMMELAARQSWSLKPALRR
ncbi:MAG: hypothetical protein Kow001_17000 [Acidobacteriota bacterium]